MGLGAFTISLIAHVIFAVIAIVFMYKWVYPPAEQVNFLPGGGGGGGGSGGETVHKIQQQQKKRMMTSAAVSKRIASTSSTATFSLPDSSSEMMDSSLPMQANNAELGSGGGSGGGSGAGHGKGIGTGKGTGIGAGMGGGGLGIQFFGLKTNAKRIAFLLDYSGSMNGEFRKIMERELAQALNKLTPDTQLLVIPWAGPAWLYNQTAPQIMSKWEKVDPNDQQGYDNFALVRGAKLDPPTWISTSPANVEEIMKGIRAQVTAPGGTDWRQPFRYAMEANPPPEVIIFMTDGQIPKETSRRALRAIDSSLREGIHVPVVNCLWIKNPTENSDHLKKLAEKYKGEFREVSSESASKE
ncbi:MAG: vWA domain-containing protein [Luteolibacter sp.]